jgi:peptidyl-tRNA hydrolase, PTH1 family
VREQDQKHFVFVGLGNPGAKYEMTRHNMGAIVVQGFAHVHGILLKEEKRFLAKVAKKSLQSATIHCLLPLTYMNESGNSVRKYLDFFKLSPADVVVVSDDVELSFGELRLRSQGSSGGHNGLKSVQQHLGTNKYARLRVGIGGKQEAGKELSDFVLDRFTKKETDQLPATVEAGVHALKLLVTNSLENAMNTINASKKEEKSENKEKKPKNTLEGDTQEEKL